MTTKIEMKELLESKFKGVQDSIFRNNTISALKFLLRMIEKYKIDCSDYYLGYCGVGNAFVPEWNILSLKTRIFGKGTKVNMTLEDSKFIISHELRHILQYRAGKLSIDDDLLVWKDGRKVRKWESSSVAQMLQFDPRQYDCLPWETDADMFALTCGEVDVTKLTNYGVIRHYEFCKERFPDQLQ